MLLQFGRKVDAGIPCTESGVSMSQYETVVKCCHELLDKLGVKPCVGTQCDDPDCESKLYHRIKDIGRQRDQLLVACMAALEVVERHTVLRMGEGQEPMYPSLEDRLKKAIEAAS